MFCSRNEVKYSFITQRKITYIIKLYCLLNLTDGRLVNGLLLTQKYLYVRKIRFMLFDEKVCPMS